MTGFAALNPSYALLNDLLRGRVGKFSLDALVALAARAGLAVHLESHWPHRHG